MKSLPRRLSHLTTLQAFILALLLSIAGFAGPFFTRPHGAQVSARQADERSTSSRSRQSAGEADSPKLSIGGVKVRRAERALAVSAGGDVSINIASSGWKPSEPVEISIYRPGAGLPDATFNLAADRGGRLTDTSLMFFSATNGLWYLIATGRESEKSVTKKFHIMSPAGGPFVNTFESTCTTFQTSFVLGDTVCAQVTAIDPMSFNTRFDWIDPDSIVQEMGPAIVASGQTDTFPIPAMGPNAKLGTWRVQITDTSDGSSLASQSFFVTAGGPEPQAIATFNADCETEQASFIGGSTVCARVTGIDAGEENTFRIDWIRPDASVAEMGPIVTMNNQADSFAIPLSGPGGTWVAQLTRLSDGGAEAQANFTVEVIPCTVFNCPDQAFSNDPGQCGATVDYALPVTEGDCGTITCTPEPGSFFPVGTTTVNCTSTAKQSCSFTVTVNDTEAPAITCPGNVITVASATCSSSSGMAVDFPPPTFSDNCPMVTAACSPLSGSTFPAGTTTVTCTATDMSGNTATCSFTVGVFTGCLQDDSNPGNVALFNTSTGEYLFCCGGMLIKTGTGTVTRQGCVVTIQHNTADRRVLIRVDFTAKKGNASLQSPPGTLRCTITDRNITNNTNCASCGAPVIK